jgi:hypothetical protein
MPLIVEDGTGIDGANSYSDLVAIRAYATLRGRTLPVDDDLVIAYAIRAMDYLESFRDEYFGTETYDDQSLAFPRDVLVNDVEIIGYMPQLLLNAQMQLVIELSNGLELFPTFVRDGRVKRKKIGPLETEWFDGNQTGLSPIIISIDWMLAGLLRQSFTLKTQRV